MKYCVSGKGKGASKMADQVVTKMLQEYSRQLFGFTRAEFDSIVEYDVINIMAYYYSKMNAQVLYFICVVGRVKIGLIFYTCFKKSFYF